MASTVHLHIGLPKTGTTYLQDVLWSQRDVLAAEGVLMPGPGHREHLWAALEVLDRSVGKRHPDAPGAWARLVAEVRAHPGPAVISHEFLSGASVKQAAAAVADLAPAEVHVVVTARHALGMLTAGWQESVKNGGRKTLEEIASQPGNKRSGEFSWRTWDLGGVLRRWGGHVPPQRVHVLPVPGPGEAPDQHWRNFAGVLGLDAGRYRLPAGATNTSLGVAQVELLRRINAHLGGFRTAADRGVWIRGYLAEGHLVQQDGQKFGPRDEEVADCRERSERAVAAIREHGYHVVGDEESLLVPAALPVLPHPDEVDDATLLEAATSLVAVMLEDVRTMKRELGTSGPDRGPDSAGNRPDGPRRGRQRRR
ncbi:MAG: hypothetical protein ACXWW7_16555 [Nocardioides sp.]